MNLLLIGNHTCGNRGDAAILRGLLEEINRQNPEIGTTVTSRYPVSSSYLLGRDVVSDCLYDWHKKNLRGIVGKIKDRFAKYWIPAVMAAEIQTNLKWLRWFLPKHVKKEIKNIERFDSVVQVGGSFFVDLYGIGQFEYPFAAILAGRPLYLIGHSMGPFDGWFYRKMASTLLVYSNMVMLRESVSSRIVVESGLPVTKVNEGSDTAWLVSMGSSCVNESLHKWNQPNSRPLIAITVRELAPFDKRLGVTQSDYEQAFASLVNDLIEEGYGVIAASTCTGIDSYHRDDRMNALRIRERVEAKEHYHVIMDELTDVELGRLFQKCKLVIGTRLHSAIISLNFGTPAIALNYEHKSAGVMDQLGCDFLSVNISELMNGRLKEIVFKSLVRMDEIRNQILPAVEAERSRATKMISMCVSDMRLQLNK